MLWTPCWNMECENQCNMISVDFFTKISKFKNIIHEHIVVTDSSLIFYQSMYKRKKSIQGKVRSWVVKFFHEQMNISVSSSPQPPSHPMFWELWGRERRDVGERLYICQGGRGDTPYLAPVTSQSSARCFKYATSFLPYYASSWMQWA